LARTVEKLRSLHTGLPVRMADSEFDRVWYGHCPVKAGLNPHSPDDALILATRAAIQI
jgi:hypothetical protein